MAPRCTVVFLLLAAISSPGEPVLAKDWRDAARELKLGDGQIRQLERDKILITDWTCSQIFQPYIEPQRPVFITSDSILNAYHVLLEESVLRLASNGVSQFWCMRVDSG